MRRLIAAGTIGAVISVLSVGQASPAIAQVATVTFVEGVVEHYTAGAKVYQRTRVGTPLNPGDRLRTGKRSRAEIRFANNNVVTLSQLSECLIHNVRDMDLARGRMRGDYVSAARVRGGSTVASVTGSSFVMGVTLVGNVAVVDVLWTEGSGTLFTPQGRRDLRAGQGVRFTQPLPPEGTTPEDIVNGSPNQPVPPDVGQSLSAPPPEWVDYTVDPQLGGTVTGAEVLNQAGSGQQVLQRLDNINTQNALEGSVQQEAQTVAVAPPGPRIRIQPPPPPPPLAQATAVGGRGARAGDRSVTVAGQMFAPSPSRVGRSLRDRRGSDWRGGIKRMRLAAPLPVTGPPAEGMEPSYFAPRFDGDLFLFAGEGRARMASARMREQGVLGGVFWEFAVSGAEFFSLRENRDRSRTAVTDARIVLRSDRWGELSIGRQRFLKGPVQNTLIGTLMRQGGRDIQDAIVWSPPLRNRRFNLDLAYIVDAFPTGLPTAVSGTQPGAYARLQYQSNFGTFALNAASHSLGQRTGVSFDFAVPLVPREVDFYGEIGKDYHARDLRTVGVYFPGLLQQADLDLFIEYTRLDDFGLPNRFLLRAYKKVTDRLAFVLAADKVGGQKVRWGAGLAIGLK